MNRVIVHLNSDPAATIKRRRNHLRESLSHIDGLTNGIVEIFVTPDCVPCFSIVHGIDGTEYCGCALESVDGAESAIAAELRKFSALCIAAATQLEGNIK